MKGNLPRLYLTSLSLKKYTCDLTYRLTGTWRICKFLKRISKPMYVGLTPQNDSKPFKFMCEYSHSLRGGVGRSSLRIPDEVYERDRLGSTFRPRG